MNFKSVLYLDDCRSPLILGIDVVRSYDQFVDYLLNKPTPELISFDHDLALEHDPFMETNPGPDTPYDTYKEKTGWHCAKWVVENNIPLKYWNVHSKNSVGAENIANVLRDYRPDGQRFLVIPCRWHDPK